MASGKHVVPNIELKQLRTFYEKCDNVALKWTKDWQWLVDEYGELHRKMLNISEKLDKDDPSAKKILRDNRSTKPIPDSVNHEYGWIAGMEEFKLQKYGPDVYKPPILPEYKIMYK